MGGEVFDRLACFLLVAHSLTTAAEFLCVELLYRRRGTRDLTRLSGIAITSPVLFKLGFLNTLVTIGFPGSSLFIAKVVFLTHLCFLFPCVGLLYGVIFLVILPCFFMRVWVPIWFGQSRLQTPELDLEGRDVGWLLVTIGGGLYLGLTSWGLS